MEKQPLKEINLIKQTNFLSVTANMLSRIIRLKSYPKKGWRVRGFYSLDKKGKTTYYSGNKFKPTGKKGNCTLRIVFASINVNAQTYINIDFK